MTKLKGIGFPVRKDITLKKGVMLYLVTDETRSWIEANDKQITYPRGFFKIDNSPNLWLNKGKKLNST